MVRMDGGIEKNVTVSDGELHFLTTPTTTRNGQIPIPQAVLASVCNPQTYGMYLVRLKGDYEPNLEISDIALLCRRTLKSGHRRWTFRRPRRKTK